MGLHDSDALAEWVIRNGLGSTVLEEPRTISQQSVLKCLRDPHTVTAWMMQARIASFCALAKAYLFTLCA